MIYKANHEEFLAGLIFIKITSETLKKSDT